MSQLLYEFGALLLSVAVFAAFVSGVMVMSK